MDELMLSGKRFISSRRIARENGYTSDYIGQLIRGGKIVGQKVGRAWYVEEASFAAYLGSEAPQVPAPIEEAESATTKESVSEVEQEPEPVAAPVLKEAPVEETPVAVVEEAPQPVEEKIVDHSEEPVHHVPLRISKKIESSAPAGGLRYYADDAPALPPIVQQPRTPVDDDIETVPMRPPALAPARTHTRTLHIGAVGVLAALVLVAAAALSTAISLNLTVEEGSTAATFYSLDW